MIYFVSNGQGFQAPYTTPSPHTTAMISYTLNKVIHRWILRGSAQKRVKVYNLKRSACVRFKV